MAKLISQSLTASFPRRAKWSPDGKCLLSATYDRKLQFFSAENGILNSSFDKKSPKDVTDIVWYPLMNTDDKSSCAFASVCPFFPVELIDSLDGHIRAQYRCQYGGDRPASIASLEFLGNSILAGGSKTLYQCDMIKGDNFGTPIYNCKGSILSLATHPSSNFLAAGKSTGKVSFLDARNYTDVLEVDFHNHGVDSICWVDHFLLSSAKLENEVIILDTRTPSVPFGFIKIERKSSRYISISYSGDNIVVGSEGSNALIYDKEFNKIGQVGENPTPIVEISKDSYILAASGTFQQISDEDIGVIEFRPILKSFSVYK
ncbi:hypothetical protein TVAG_114690 [Trichomonas vaginalis G3]|uniref:Uncharacterized protein n=1 Tax=Trichomonas vaginalis (strain ATCC PRA-98 / G3) TaxID=412133 RepID=A2FGJ2_TRIV3|nr:hypothetical protein TVAGG3_0037050 [Trichomonas vaginalis G3]EAX95958.1 hypothetical protein TVAG_114690 [Trichomonas vaginalis G3]KAI5540457.1 hypothetical protein TVAGG3_0037050 [Trichomonas vaginalis G3]|eukprot:XP_001308888.1 hypothetical protein [Trichomonas vaginalis G3]